MSRAAVGMGRYPEVYRRFQRLTRADHVDCTVSLQKSLLFRGCTLRERHYTT